MLTHIPVSLRGEKRLYHGLKKSQQKITTIIIEKENRGEREKRERKSTELK